MIRGLGVRLCWVLWVCRQPVHRPSRMMWCPHKFVVLFGFLFVCFYFWCVSKLHSWLFLSALILQMLGPAFAPLTCTFMEGHNVGQWLLSSGLCCLAWRLFAGRLATWAGGCHPPCQVREAEQMGPFALLVVLAVCLANANRRWGLLRREGTRGPLRFT